MKILSIFVAFLKNMDFNTKWGCCQAKIDDVGGSLPSLCQELDPLPVGDEKIIIVMQKGGAQG